MNIVSDVVSDGRTSVEGTQDVRRRKVFYIAGFDPMGPRRYRELYRVEGARQSAVAGYRLQVRGVRRLPGGHFAWRAIWHQGRVTTVAEFEFLGWDDLVRQVLHPSLPGIYLVLFRTFWIYLRSGAITAMWRLRAGPLVAGLVPAALMIFYLLYAGMIGLAAGMLAAGPLGLPAVAGVAVGVVAWALAMRATRTIDQRMLAYFMVSDLGYMAAGRGRYPAALSDRIDRFSRDIADAVASTAYDEVLVVGHSSGAQLAVTAMARALRRQRPVADTRLGLLTLGQAIAMTSFLPEAGELRADLAQLAEERGVFWLDVTAPGDGACFALSDPVATCRRRGRSGQVTNPLVISAAFRQTMGPNQWRRLRWRLLRLHFQYLCSFAQPRDFDYFRITAGPTSLATRFAGRRCSPSMQARPIAPICHSG